MNDDISARLDDLIDELEVPIDSFAVYELLERSDLPKSLLGYAWRKVHLEYEFALAEGDWQRADKLRPAEAKFRSLYAGARPDLGSDPVIDYAAADAHVELLRAAGRKNTDRIIRAELKRLRANAA